jgi:hypothetical protein
MSFLGQKSYTQSYTAYTIILYDLKNITLLVLSFVYDCIVKYTIFYNRIRNRI